VETVWNEANVYEPGIVATGTGPATLQAELSKLLKNPLVLLGGLVLAMDAGFLGDDDLSGDGEGESGEAETG